jgi:hypothetical protein
MVNRPLFWHPALLSARLAASLREHAGMVTSLARHLSRVYGIRLDQPRSFSKLAR